MSVDFYTCPCGYTFSDCGDFAKCECGKKWCSDECANDDGFEISEEDGSKSCNYCREEDFEDFKLLDFALDVLNISRHQLIEDYKKNKE